ncbi:MAG: GNAT family N-acetyltransferase [Clostridiales bacterium]|nr:GNAT family N-acetyltransferase [Clostridiales bacterium]
MGIIRTHDFTLYGRAGEFRIALRPLRDAHLPLLYKWNADPEVLYWTCGGEDDPDPYEPEDVETLYRNVSKRAYCFLVEVDGEPVGDCWLLKMELPDVLAMYPPTSDIRRIDMTIGEKSYWNKGIGTAFVGMLVKFAFYYERADAIHCLLDDFNRRSMRVWEKHGFRLVRADELEQPQKGKKQLHYALTSREYRDSRAGQTRF